MQSVAAMAASTAEPPCRSSVVPMLEHVWWSDETAACGITWDAPRPVRDSEGRQGVREGSEALETGWNIVW